MGGVRVMNEGSALTCGPDIGRLYAGKHVLPPPFSTQAERSSAGHRQQGWAEARRPLRNVPPQLTEACRPGPQRLTLTWD